MYRIAIVDDDYMVRESTKAVIERNFKEENLEAKFRTDTVLSDRDTGKIVNPHLRQIYLQSELSQELFTVYILDIELPDGNGLELAKEIRKIQERAYIVFLTAYEKYALFGYEVRAFHYIIKENMEKKLVQTMRHLQLNVQRIVQPCDMMKRFQRREIVLQGWMPKISQRPGDHCS